MSEKATALVIGGGPAGLMAAETMVDAGLRVRVVDQKPSLGRKFLMAGKSGLNLTKDEPEEHFRQHIKIAPHLRPVIESFGPKDVQAWANALDAEVFTGSSGRVFPKAMKASPLLRAWLARLRMKGVEVDTKWKWIGFDGKALRFETPDGLRSETADVTILACGGASWQRLGSDGQWAHFLSGTVPFAPSNVGVTVDWSPHMSDHFGKPIKGLGLRAGNTRIRGEAVVSERGLEGGGIYAMSAELRDGASLIFDLLPDLDLGVIETRLERASSKDSVSNVLRKALKLDRVKIALFHEFADKIGGNFAHQLKNLPVKVTGLGGLDEAISTVGGVDPMRVNAGLMLENRPGIFVSGEMIDWDAPTGGYLITTCLASGRWAGQHAVEWLDQSAAAL